MSRHRRIKQGDDNTDINISPMIDMVFILLIFFIVTTVFVDERGIPIDKPQPAPPDQEQTESDEPIIFNIQNNGQILHHGNAVNVSQIEKIVRDGLSRADVPVILQVQRNALSGLLVQVIDNAYAGTADKISVTAVD